jgi:hypothetical protein
MQWTWLGLDSGLRVWGFAGYSHRGGLGWGQIGWRSGRIQEGCYRQGTKGFDVSFECGVEFPGDDDKIRTLRGNGAGA